MASERITLISAGSLACVISVVCTYFAIQFVLDGNDDAAEMLFVIPVLMSFTFLSGVCGVLFGIRGSAPEWMRKIIGIDETGRSEPTGDPIKDKEISPLWALLALCFGFLVLLFLYYFVIR